MFPKVKNVNVESPKNRSKLLDFPRDGADGDGGRYGGEIVCAGVSFVFAVGNDELADGHDESPGRNDEFSCGNDGSSLRFIASFEPSIGSVM